MPVRSELVRWAFRGAGVAAGGATVLGLILLANAAIGVLSLVLVAILLASALGASFSSSKAGSSCRW